MDDCPDGTPQHPNDVSPGARIGSGLLAAWVARKQRACLACCRQAIETKELPCSQMPSRFGFSDSVPAPDQAELGDVKGSQRGGSQTEGGGELWMEAGWDRKREEVSGSIAPAG